MQIKPRSFPLSVLRQGVPRHWLGGSVLATHLANGVNLLFPAGERFFVRSVRHYLKQIEGDPALVEAVRGFAGQEGHHARAHEEVFELLEQQGYDIRGFLRGYEALAYRVIEKVAPASLRLATTAACEHFTAVMAENFLTEMVDEAGLDPAMRQLFMWHACEEIEHRAVAFEVFQRVDGRHAMRMAGLAMATAMLASFWIAGTIHLLRQEQHGVVGTLRREGAAMKERQPFSRRVFGRGIREYVERDFHPSKRKDLDDLASAYLEKFTAMSNAQATV